MNKHQEIFDVKECLLDAHQAIVDEEYDHALELIEEARRIAQLLFDIQQGPAPVAKKR